MDRFPGNGESDEMNCVKNIQESEVKRKLQIEGEVSLFDRLRDSIDIFSKLDETSILIEVTRKQLSHREKKRKS